MKVLFKLLIGAVVIFNIDQEVFAEGKFINPFTDVCWKCLYPIHVAGKNVTSKHKDFVKYTKTFCKCGINPAGIPVSLWEPTRLVEVTRTPYKLLALGGVSLSKAGIKKRGAVSTNGDGMQTSFYHVHYYRYPVFALIGMAENFVCTEANSKNFDIDIAYMSEYDPFWSDDKWAAVLNPQSLLFSNALAQAACLADCAQSTFRTPNEAVSDRLFWCAGCHGSLYPLVGHVPHHVGGIQASSLLVTRILAKLHAWGALKGFEKDNFCQTSRMLRLKKTIYKTQLAYPVAQTKGNCNAIGQSDLKWGANKSYPFGGEDFVYLIWTKRQCCLDPVNIAQKVMTGSVQ